MPLDEGECLADSWPYFKEKSASWTWTAAKSRRGIDIGVGFTV